MAVWKHLVIALAFSIAGADAGPCKTASLSTTTTTTLDNTLPSSTSLNDGSNPILSPIVSTAIQTTSTAVINKVRSVTTQRARATNTASTRKPTKTSTKISKPKPTPFNFLSNPGFDDPSGISFSQPWVFRSSQKESKAEPRNGYPFKSGPTVLYMRAKGDDAPSVEQWVAGLEKTKQYRLSAWVAYKSGSGACHLDLKLGKTLVKRHTIPKHSPGKYEKVGGVVSSKFQMDLVSMWLYCPSEESIAIFVDNFSFVEISE